MEAAIAGKPMIKVAAICDSLRKAFFNHGIRSAMEISKESISGLHIDYIDIAPLSMLNTDLEVDGKYPLVVQAFRQKILEADSYLFASPEYNYSLTGRRGGGGELLGFGSVEAMISVVLLRWWRKVVEEIKWWWKREREDQQLVVAI